MSALWPLYLPLYRQVQILAGQSIHLDCAALAGWLKRAAWWLKNLYDLQLQEGAADGSGWPAILAVEAMNYALNH